MNNNTRALVIVYNGNEPGPEALKNIAEYVAALCEPTVFPCIYTLDENDIVKAIGKVTVVDTDTKENDPVEHAVVYIGTRFAKSLTAGDSFTFISELATALIEERIAGMHSELRNAVKIIAGSSYDSVKPSLREKYHVSKRHFEIIKRIAARV